MKTPYVAEGGYSDPCQLRGIENHHAGCAGHLDVVYDHLNVSHIASMQLLGLSAPSSGKPRSLPCSTSLAIIGAQRPLHEQARGASPLNLAALVNCSGAQRPLSRQGLGASPLNLASLVR